MAHFAEDATAACAREEDPLAHDLQRAWLLVGRHLSRYGYRLAVDNGTLTEALEGFAHARARARGTAPSWSDAVPGAEELDRQLAVLDTGCPEQHHTRRDALRRRLQLDETDFYLLMTQAALALCPDLARAAKLARSGDAPSAFLAELLSTDPADARRLARRLGSSASLRRRGFMDADCDVSDAVLDALCGVPRPLPTPLRAWVTVATAPTGPLVLSQPIDVDLDGPTPLLIGPAGVGKEAVACRAVAAIQRTGQGEWPTALWTLDLSSLLASRSAQAQLVQVCLEALVAGAVLHIRLPADPVAPTAVSPLAAILADSGITWLMSTEREESAAALAPAAHRIVMGAPGSEAQYALWLRMTADDSLARQMTGRFRLTPGRIVHAAAHTADYTVEGLSRTVRDGCSHRLHDLADPVSCTHSWDDLVVPDRVRAALDEIAMQGRLRFEVLSGWGFERRLGYGTGLGCLFFGPPGTGKTMTAGLIAAELGLPIYRVDLSRIVSKYIGETEKNLRRLFAEASSARAILLFDEADGLFAKRTKVKDAKDRFANMEVAFLLQQMEAYDGISILTTNLEADLDEALRRRLRFRVYFPAPDEAERARLWSQMLPAAAPVNLDDIDFEGLGESFEFSGGYIRNAALRAAFRAAAGGHAINHETLYDAARAEATELGMLVRHD